MTRLPSETFSIPTAVTQSKLWQMLMKSRMHLVTAAEQSTVTGPHRSLRRVTTNSWLYRWLTKEPDPEVIVIDLRETWTVGPIIGLLDDGIATFSTGYQGSRSEAVVRGMNARFKKQPVRLVSGIIISIITLMLVFEILLGEVSRTYLAGSGLVIILAAVGLLVDMSWEELKETTTMKYLIAFLEPPEPPET